MPFFSIDLFDRSFSKQRSIEKFDRDNVFDCGKFGEKYKRALAAARSDSRSGAAEAAHSFDAWHMSPWDRRLNLSVTSKKAAPLELAGGFSRRETK